MRVFRVFLSCVLAASAVLSGAASAGEALHLDLKNGSKFDGRITASDDAAFTFKTTSGGEVRIAWKDLDVPSYLAAKKLVVDPKDGRGLLDLAKFAADNSLRGEAAALVFFAVRADGSLKADADALAPRLAELKHAEAVALFERGQAFMEKQQWYQALGRFQDARKLEPNYAAAINGAGEAYFSMRRLKEARRCVDEAIAVDPTCKDALFNRAYLALLELDFKACLSGLDEVAALPPTAGRFATREEVYAAGKKAGVEKESDVWKTFADGALIQARELRPAIREIVRGPGFAKEFVATTEHYDLRCDVSQEYADTIAERMELIYAEYERRYSYERTGEQKTRGRKLRFPVLVFQDKDGYVQWFTRVLKNPAMAQASGGVYIPFVKHLVFFQNKTFEDTQLVAWHEGFHQYLDYFVGEVPHWFNEGQAEYYGASRLDKSGKKVTVGHSDPWRIPALAALLDKKRLPRAEWLMKCTPEKFMRLEPLKPGETGSQVWTAGENYASSWALVHFCLEGEKGRWSRLMMDYFKALCDGVSADEAFEKAWGRVGWDAFNAAFESHCRWLVQRARDEQKFFK
jgi:tetratricopeptide (TPR) repeat protein